MERLFFILAAMSLMAVARLPAADAPRVYAGSDKCRACHAAFYDRWATSHHGLAMQPFTPDFARRNLTTDNRPIQAGRAKYTVDLSDKGGRMREASGHANREYPIQYALGGKNIYYFLTTLERGHLQVMPLAYDVRARVWLDTTASMGMHESGVRDAPVDWRDRSLTFNTSCYGCHVSQLAANYDSKSDSYRTTWTEPGINCETCHGPSEAHVRQGGDSKIVSMKNLTVQQRNDTCASCHAKLVRVAEGFQPGARFADHYSLVALESDDYYPDGRDKRENYTLTSWMMSACVKSGKLDCMHCHTSSGQYKFSADKEANNACLPCHAERVKNAAAHSHHAEGTSGSRCVSCHMPTTTYARMTRSDHSMRPPAPASSLAYGSPNACNGCHADKSASWADRQARQWFRRDYQARDYQAPVLERAALIDAARKQGWSKLSAMLAAISTEPDEVFRASLIRLLADCRDERRFPALLHALQDPSPMVRASAVDALADHVQPDTVGPLVKAARDSFRTVRIRAGAALSSLDPSGLDGQTRAAVDRAIGEYVQSMRSYPDDYAQRMNLGVFHADRGQWNQALAEYAQAMRLRPAVAPPLVNAALVYNQLGRNAEAESSLRRALAIDPDSAAAHLNLGLLLAETGRVVDAETALRRSLDLDKTNSVAAYNLAVIVGKERPAEAAQWCRIAVENGPGEPKYSYTLAYFLSKSGNLAQAISVLEQARDRHAIESNGVNLLNELYRARPGLNH